MNETKRRLARLEQQPVATNRGEMSELQRYSRLLAILDEAPDEAARVCNLMLTDVVKWRAH